MNNNKMLKALNTKELPEIKNNKEYEVSFKSLNQFFKDYELNVIAKSYEACLTSVIYKIYLLPKGKISKIEKYLDEIALYINAYTGFVKIKKNLPNKDYFEIHTTTKKIPNLNLGYILSDFDIYKRINNTHSDLCIPIGVDTRKNCSIIDLQDNSPILISGKSKANKFSFLNSLLVSLMYQNSSENLKFIIFNLLGDEFNLINKTDYMFSDVVTDKIQLKSTIQKIHEEFNLRKDLFRKHKVNNINEYNNLPNVKKLCNICLLINDLDNIVYATNDFYEDYFYFWLDNSKYFGIYIIYQLDIPSREILNTTLKGLTNDFIMFKASTKVDSDFVYKNARAEELINDDEISYNSLHSYHPKFLKIPHITAKEVEDFIKLL